MGAALGASVAGSALGVVGGFSKWREGRRMSQEAQRKIDSFEWESLENPYRNLAVSTLGADLQREEASRAAATNVEALRAAGTRGLGVGAGRVMQSVNNNNREIAANLDQQRKAIDFAAAGDDVRIRDMIENRQSNELAGYGQMLNVGNQMKYGGTADMLNGVQAAGQSVAAYQAYKDGRPNPVGGMGGGMMGGNPSMTYNSPSGIALPQPNNIDPSMFNQTWNPAIYG